MLAPQTTTLGALRVTRVRTVDFDPPPFDSIDSVEYAGHFKENFTGGALKLL